MVSFEKGNVRAFLQKILKFSITYTMRDARPARCIQRNSPRLTPYLVFPSHLDSRYPVRGWGRDHLCSHDVKELRMAGIVPMTPLSVKILGADISPYALDLYRDQFEQLVPILAGVGISVRLETRTWDATDVQQTNNLIDDYLEGAGAHNEYFVIVANLSGASKTLFRQFEESFKQIWIRLSGRASSFQPFFGSSRTERMEQACSRSLSKP